MCLPYCLQLSALEPLLYIAPPQILEMILEQFAKVLPNDSTAQRMFISTGGLKKVLEIDTSQHENISQCVESVKKCFSPDIIKFYMPMENSLNSNNLNQLQPKVNRMILLIIFFNETILYNTYRTFSLIKWSMSHHNLNCPSVHLLFKIFSIGFFRTKYTVLEI